MRDLSAFGLDSHQALRQTLSLFDTPDAAAGDARPMTAQDLAIELESRGVHARLVQVDAADLRYVEAPALLLVDGDLWLLLKGGRNVQTPSGDITATAHELSASFRGQAIEIVPRLAVRRSIFGSMFRLLAKTPGAVTAATLTLLFHLLAIVSPLLTKMVIDRSLPEHAVSLLDLIVIAVVVTATYRYLVAWLRGRAILYLQTRLEKVVERTFLEHVMRLPFPFLQRRTIGDVLQAFDGLRTARELLTERAMATILDLVPALFYIVFMAVFMPAAAIVVFGGALTIIVLTMITGRRQAATQRRELDAQRRQRSLLVEMLTGITTIKSSGVESRMTDAWGERLRHELRLGLERQRLRLWTDVGGELLRDLLLAFLLIYGASRVISGDLTAGSLVAVLQMASALALATTTFATEYQVLVTARPQLEKASELLAEAPEQRPALRQQSATALRSPVIADDLWFRYAADGPWILRGLQLRVEPGEKRRIVGPSGFGKTTLLRLLAGIYTPQQGTLRIGPMPAIAASPLVMYLPQFATLFTGSILDNLKVISGASDRARLFEAAAETGLAEWVESLPMGYETLVSAGGASLSGGQRQLIAITAVAASPRPLLLLDEPMANLDASMQHRVINCHLFKNKTVIYAAHAEPWNELTV